MQDPRPAKKATATTTPLTSIEPLVDADTLRTLLRKRWGETLMMYGRAWKLGDYNALVAYDEHRTVLGLVTYAVLKSVMLVLTVDNFSQSPGIGKALLAEVTKIGKSAGAKTLRVLTTNDNTPTLRYFQMRGYRIVAFYPGAIAVYRAVTPTLPEIGVDGIPVRDAIELEIDL